jgi:hypothetical protein
MHQSRAKEKKMKVIPGGNQMSLIRDTEEVIKFLEFASRKSIMNEHAVTCRLTACHNLFSVLNEEEDSLDYILSNLDVLINRFRNKNSNVQASTLKVYKSRVKSSIEDFKEWSADPFAWERSLTDKAARSVQQEARKEKQERKQKAKKIAPKAAPAPQTEETEVSARATAAAPRPGMRKVSFPINGDFCVEMWIPAEGMSLKELHRLGLFLFPYCNDLETDKIRGPWSLLPGEA